MLQHKEIESFLQQKIIAVVGVSKSGDLPANYIFEKFRDNNYTVYAINPNAQTVNDTRCYPDIKSTPEKPEAVVLASTPTVSLQVARQCIELGIKHIWMHRGIGAGSFEPEAEELCKANQISPIVNGCPMMFVGKVDFFHRFLKWTKS